MRDPKRIDRIIELIRKIWYLYPDWRIGQLLINITQYRHDMFYLEDDKLEEALNVFLAHQKDWL